MINTSVWEFSHAIFFSKDRIMYFNYQRGTISGFKSKSNFMKF